MRKLLILSVLAVISGALWQDDSDLCFRRRCRRRACCRVVCCPKPQPNGSVTPKPPKSPPPSADEPPKLLPLPPEVPKLTVPDSLRDALAKKLEGMRAAQK